MRVILFLALLLTACTHAPPKVPQGTGLFPYGAYRHKVNIQVLEPKDVRPMEMRGAVSVTAQEIRVVGLSTFGTTIFRIEENLKTGEIKKEYYLEIIKKNPQRFVEFYYLIRELLTAPKDATSFERRGAHFTISAPDSQGIFRKVHVVNSQVELNIEVTGYEL